MFSISISPFLCASVVRFSLPVPTSPQSLQLSYRMIRDGWRFSCSATFDEMFWQQSFQTPATKKKRWGKKASIRTNWMIRVFVFLCFMCSESFHCWHRKVSRIVLSLRRNVWPLTVVCLTDAFSYSQRSSTVDTDILGIFNLKTLSKSWYAPCFQFFFKNFRRNVLPSLC